MKLHFRQRENVDREKRTKMNGGQSWETVKDRGTFLQTHVYHSRLSQLQEEVLVFLILLVVNYFHTNNFAARREKKRGEKEEKEETRQGVKEEGEGERE